MPDEKKQKDSKQGGKPQEAPVAAKPQFGQQGSANALKYAKRKNLEKGDFRGVLRIVGQDVDGHMTVAEALRKIKGIGTNLATVLVDPVTQKLNIDAKELIGNLTEEQTGELETLVKFPQKLGVKVFMLNRQQDLDTGETKHLLMSDLTFTIRQDIVRERDSRSYRGWRHSLGQKSRGQHTRTTGRTGMTVGGLKKAVKAQKAAAATGAQDKSAPAKETKK